MTTRTDRTAMQLAWADHCAKYDLMSSPWFDMGADEYFAAGWKAATERAALAQPTEQVLASLPSDLPAHVAQFVTRTLRA